MVKERDGWKDLYRAAATSSRPMSELHLFGVRHHGPGSARSLVRALQSVQPDIVLIEGPPDANDLLPLAAHAGLEPPVALLIYLPERPGAAVLYPMASFSPEWQAIRYGLEHSVPLRFIDLPQSLRMTAATPGESEGEGEDEEDEEAAPARGDPLAPMAMAAGYSDAERWWDQLVESREGHDLEVFKAVHEMMSALRAALGEPMPLLEQRREAHMRKCIRTAVAEKFARIAVVCGAWHLAGPGGHAVRQGRRRLAEGIGQVGDRSRVGAVVV